MRLVFLTLAVAQLDLMKGGDDEGTRGFLSESPGTDDVDPCDDDGGSKSKVGSELYWAV